MWGHSLLMFGWLMIGESAMDNVCRLQSLSHCMNVYFCFFIRLVIYRTSYLLLLLLLLLIHKPTYPHLHRTEKFRFKKQENRYFKSNKMATKTKNPTSQWEENRGKKWKTLSGDYMEIPWALNTQHFSAKYWIWFLILFCVNVSMVFIFSKLKG